VPSQAAPNGALSIWWLIAGGAVALGAIGWLVRMMRPRR
jgi:hypothetical protein